MHKPYPNIIVAIYFVAKISANYLQSTHTQEHQYRAHSYDV